MTGRTLLALGDSISCGEGVGVLLRREETWVARTAAALGYQLELLARPGARVHDVRAEQAPVAAQHPARLVTLLIGLNDVIRSGFDADAVRADLAAAVDCVRRPGRTVLVMRLYDPTLLLPMPGWLRRHFIDRVRVINGSLDGLRGNGVIVVDLAGVGPLRLRGAWAVDRLHPGPCGNQAIAAAGTAALQAAGFDVRRPPQVMLVPEGPTRRAEARWLMCYGIPYLACHLGEMGAPLARALVRSAS